MKRFALATLIACAYCLTVAVCYGVLTITAEIQGFRQDAQKFTARLEPTLQHIEKTSENVCAVTFEAARVAPQVADNTAKTTAGASAATAPFRAIGGAFNKVFGRKEKKDAVSDK